jgi:hypothetical protein
MVGGLVGQGEVERGFPEVLFFEEAVAETKTEREISAGVEVSIRWGGPRACLVWLIGAGSWADG